MLNVGAVKNHINHYPKSNSPPNDLMSRFIKNASIFAGKGVLQLDFDKKRGGLWDRSDLLDYAIAVRNSTGVTVDIDALIEVYGNEDGMIDAKGQAELMKDDALMLAFLQDEWVKMNASGENPAEEPAAVSSTFRKHINLTA